KVFWDITSASSGQSWAQQTWYPVPDIIDSSAANNNFEATFSADLANKDVNLAVEAGEAAGLNLAAAQLARSQLQHLIEEGLGGKDCSLITKYVRNDEALEGYIQRNEPGKVRLNHCGSRVLCSEAYPQVEVSTPSPVPSQVMVVVRVTV